MEIFKTYIFWCNLHIDEKNSFWYDSIRNKKGGKLK